MPNQLIIQLKSFGDLIIALTICRKAHSSRQGAAAVGIGSHLLPLYRALLTDVPVIEIAHSEANVPAAFDVKKHGLLAAARSMLVLRHAMQRLPLDSDTELVFDRLHFRERFTAGWRRCRSLPPAENVYLAYTALYETSIRDGAPTKRQLRTAARIGVFPGSRVASKAMPEAVVKRAMLAIRGAGFEANLFLLEGEQPALERAFPQATILPRKFEAMIAAISSQDAVISADSMPAHVAEYHGVPCFVINPSPNTYWLPESCFWNGRWCLFEGDWTSLNNYLNALPR